MCSAYSLAHLIAYWKTLKVEQGIPLFSKVSNYISLVTNHLPVKCIVKFKSSGVLLNTFSKLVIIFLEYFLLLIIVTTHSFQC